MKVQYNSLTMLMVRFMQKFGPNSSRVHCIFPAQPIAMFKLSICSSYGWITQPQTCYWLFERKYNTHVTR
jgi:hypothetical protein